MKLVSIITPTIGRPLLRRCLESVERQNYPYIQHVVVVDGEEHRERAQAILKDFPDVDVIWLPYPTGNWGGRIYGSATHLTRGEYISHLDDDDTIEPEHIESLLNSIGSSPWAFCFRNIMADGMFLARDKCESLGTLHAVFHDMPKPNPGYHLGTGSSLLTRRVALELCWLYAAEQFNDSLYFNDRQFFQALRTRYPDAPCTLQYTMNYEVDVNRTQFFLNGNEEMKKRYGDALPWEKGVAANA